MSSKLEKGKLDLLLKAVKDASDTILDSYEDTISVVNTTIEAGRWWPIMGIQGLDMFYELLHGGSYRWDVDPGQVPSYIYIQTRSWGLVGSGGDETKSPFYCGVTINQLLAMLASVAITGGGALDYAFVVADSKVPRILPKLISDYDYAQWKLLRSQDATLALIKGGASVLATLVESGSKTFAGIQSTGLAGGLSAQQDALLKLAATKK